MQMILKNFFFFNKKTVYLKFSFESNVIKTSPVAGKFEKNKK
jgi:hypothetical protein